MENSPSGLWRTLGKRVGVTASRVRISYSPPVGFSDDSGSPFFMPENGFLSAIPTSLAHMPFCRVMPSNDVGNADIDDTLGDTHDGPNRCVTLSSKGAPACSLIPTRRHMRLTPPASTFSSGSVMPHVCTYLLFLHAEKSNEATRVSRVAGCKTPVDVFFMAKVFRFPCFRFMDLFVLSCLFLWLVFVDVYGFCSSLFYRVAFRLRVISCLFIWSRRIPWRVPWFDRCLRMR